MEHYGGVKQFMREADRLGISRRIPETWIKKLLKYKSEYRIFPPCFLAYREASAVVKENGEVEKKREIFTSFIPNALEYVVNGS